VYKLKKDTIKVCLDKITKSKQALLMQQNEISNAIANETKSSAGDKFETSREMMNQEKSKIAEQLIQQNYFETQLKAIRLDKSLTEIDFGAFVSTDKGYFLIAAALGKIENKDFTFFAISDEAPLFKAMKGKKENESFNFRNNSYKIEHIA